MHIRTFLISACSSALFACAASAQEWAYEQDFEGTPGNEWADTTFETSSQLGRFLGRRGGGERTELLFESEPSTDYIVFFDLYLFDSWDGNHSRWGPDRIIVRNQNQIAFSHTFRTDGRNQSYPYGPTERGRFGGSGTTDGVYRRVRVDFTSSGPESRLSWQGSGLESPSNESWGIDNVRVIRADEYETYTDNYDGPGLRAQWFFESHSLSVLNSIDWRRPPDHETIEPLINWERTRNALMPEVPRDLFGVRLSGSIEIPESGYWQFRLTSDDGSDLFIGDERVIVNDGLHSMRRRTGSIELTAGSHPIEARVFENRGHIGLILEWRPPSGGSWAVVPEEAFSVGASEPVRVVRWREVAPGD